MIGFRVRTLFPVQKFRREQVFAGITEQSFLNTVLVFHFPRNIKNVLNDAVVGKWNTGFQTGVHTCAVHAVEQCLHKPFDVQISDIIAFPLGFRLV